MRTLLRLTFITIIFLIASRRDAKSQAIIIDFVNKKLSSDGLSWEFDMVAKGDATYGGAENGQWIAMNVYIDLSLPAGVSVVNGVCTPDPTFASASGGVQNKTPGPPGIPGQAELGLTSERADSDQDLNNTTFVKLAHYVVNFSSAVLPNNSGFPRFQTTDFGSTWSNYANDQLLRPITFVNAEFPLPVKLISFDATSEGGQTNLTWKTSEESNSSHFDIQRSKDGKLWSTIATIQAAGESKLEKPYTAVDSNPLAGENLYRLSMVDKDGTVAYSSIRSVKFSSLIVDLYPNPVVNELVVKIPGENKLSEVSVVNMSGVEVISSRSQTVHNINVETLKVGMYVVNVKTKGGEVTSKRILVNK